MLNSLLVVIISFIVAILINKLIEQKMIIVAKKINDGIRE